MTGNRLRPPVVVAIDSGDNADQAVDWAAAEAAERDSPLVIVHVLHPPLALALDAYGFIPITDAPPGARAVGAEVLHAALSRAAMVASELQVSAELVSGVPTRVLLDLSRDAALLVLGGRSGRGHNVLTGSVAGRLASRATCPVVVIRRRPRMQPEPGPARTRVVVGVDGSRCCSAALDFAFRAAAQRGIPLTAVHAWGADAPADLEGVCGSRPVTEAHARRNLDLLLEPRRERFAGVAVHARVLRADPAAALVAESEGAALVVVGSRGRGAVRGTLFGSVSRSLLQRAHSPLVVVRPDWPAGDPRGTRSVRRRALPAPTRTEWSRGRSTRWE